MTHHRITGTLSDQDAASIMAAIITIKRKLPFLIDLTPEERCTLTKRGEESRGWIRSALDLALRNPALLPWSFNTTEFWRNVTLEETLAPIAAALRELAAWADDTLVAVGSDTYDAALAVYHHAEIGGLGAPPVAGQTPGLRPALPPNTAEFSNAHALPAES